MRKIKNIFIDKFPSIMLFVLIDLFITILSSLLAIWVSFDFGEVSNTYLQNVVNYLPFDFFILVAFFIVFKLYISVWKYASVTELINIIFACTFTELISIAYKYLFDIKLPKSFFLLQLILLIMLTCTSRFSFRIARAVTIRLHGGKSATRTMLIGAGDAGKMIIDEIYNDNSAFKTKIVCVVDDRKSKVGSYIRGLKIAGTTKDIARLAE